MREDASDLVSLPPGIHNEPGLETLPLTTSRALLLKMIELATDTTDKDRSFVPFANDGKDEVVLMVNNLGGISELEFGGLVVCPQFLLNPLRLS